MLRPTAAKMSVARTRPMSLTTMTSHDMKKVVIFATPIVHER